MTPPGESLASQRLWLAFATMLLVAGITNTFPVFLPALLAEFGGSRGATASTASLLWLGGALLSPVAGYLVARWNPRLLVCLGLGLVAGGMVLGSLAPTLPAFLLAMGIGGGVGLGLTGMTTHAALIADAYVRRRGLATGIAFGGSMAAYALAAPAQWIITHWGWRPAFWCYAAAIAALIPWAWRSHPTRLGSAADRGPVGSGPAPVTVAGIVRSAGFWSLLVMFSTPPLFGYLATTQHTLYFTERGFTAGEASMLLAIGGVLAGLGRALAGLVADRFGGPTAGFLSFSCSLLGMLCLIAMEVRPLWILAAGYVLFLFLPLGSRASIVTVLLGRLAPPAHYGVIFGLLGIGNNLGAALGPWLSGVLFDRTGTYLVIYLAALGIALVGLGALTVFCLTTRAARA
ncbi:MAG TPA: MFS transporter [Methylomirabilota bacterium]|nr:MFS transporter [Methylomirabilota bacterium]